MVGPASSVPHALHPDRIQLGQPGRTLVRVPHRRHDPPRRPQVCTSPRSRHPGLGRRLERQPETLHLDQDRATDPRIPRTTLSTNLRRGTLAVDPVTGVRLVAGVEASRTAAEPPEWGDRLDGFRMYEASELPDGFATGFLFMIPRLHLTFSLFSLAPPSAVGYHP